MSKDTCFCCNTRINNPELNRNKFHIRRDIFLHIEQYMSHIFTPIKNILWCEECFIQCAESIKELNAGIYEQFGQSMFMYDMITSVRSYVKSTNRTKLEYSGELGVCNLETLKKFNNIDNLCLFLNKHVNEITELDLLQIICTNYDQISIIILGSYVHEYGNECMDKLKVFMTCYVEQLFAIINSHKNYKSIKIYECFHGSDVQCCCMS